MFTFFTISAMKLFNFSIVIRNGKIVWKHGPYCWSFRLNLKYPGSPYRAYTKTAKNGNFCEELHSENDIEVVLAIFCCYNHGVKTSEAVQKIATDQKEYRKCSLCVIICWIAKIHLAISINQSSNKQWKVVGYKETPDVAKKSCWSCTEKRAITGPWWVLSIMEVR